MSRFSSMFSRRAVIAAATLSASLGLAKEASANDVIEIDYENKLTVPITLIGVNDWNSQRWITTNPNFAESPVCEPGPPAQIPAGQGGCFYSQATGLLEGTGGTITYSIPATQEYDANGNRLPLPSVAVTWTWDTPYDSLPPVGIGDYSGGSAIIYATNGGAVTGPAEGGYVTGTYGINGYIAEFTVSQNPPRATMASSLVGSAGTAVAITGAGFDTTGLTQVFFNGLQSPEVTCALTLCTAVAPDQGRAVGTVPVTMSLNGASSTVGSFTYLDNAPSPKSADSAAAFLSTSKLAELEPSDGRVDALDLQMWTGVGSWTSQQVAPTPSPDVANAGISPATTSAAVSRSSTTLDVVFADGNSNLNWLSGQGTVPAWSETTIVAAPEFILSPIPASLVPANANVTLADRTPSNLDTFYIGHDGGIWTSYWAAGASWSGVFELPGTAGLAPAGGGIAAVARTANNLDVFYVSNGGYLYQSSWTPAGWAKPNPIGASAVAPPGAHLTAVARTTYNLDVFYVGSDGALGTAYWHTGLASFAGPFDVPGTAGLAQAGAPLSAVSRQPTLIDVAFAGGGTVYDESFNGTAWVAPAAVTSGVPYVPGNLPIAIVAPSSQTLDILFQDVFTGLGDASWTAGAAKWQVTSSIPRFAACEPSTCATLDATCGTPSDGCGGSVFCGSCTAPQTCGGGPAANQCGCTPTTCALHAGFCGSMADGCGGTLDCTCSGTETCSSKVCCPQGETWNAKDAQCTKGACSTPMCQCTAAGGIWGDGMCN